MNKEKCCDAMNEGDMHLIVCGLDKGHTTDHLTVISWGEKNHFSYSPEEFLLNADIVIRLREETKSLENYLMHHANEMPDNSRREISLRLIAFQKILKGGTSKD